MAARRLTLLAAAGLAAGAAAGYLLLPAGGGTIAATSTTAAATTTTTLLWASARETRIGPAVVVPTGLQMEGDRVLFTYDLSPISPTAALASPDRPPEDPATASPASFTLTYPGGTVSARALGPGQRAGRFEVPDGIGPAEVEAITIDSYWVPVPAGYEIDLSPTSGAWVPAAPGVRARIAQVVDQAENYLVIVELDSEPLLAEDLGIAGKGREWQASSHAMSPGTRWTLDFRGDTLPDPVRLTVRGVAWIEVPGGGPVDLQGVPR